MNTLKTVLASFLLSLSASAQYQTIAVTGNSPASISVSGGQIVEIENFSSPNTGEAALKLSKDGTEFIVLQSIAFGLSTTNTTTVPKLLFVGPCTLTTQSGSSSKFVLTYKLSENTNVATGVPSTAVVIPADSAGPVKIILESSVDLVTWTEALPGSYGTTTQKRFFRVRAIAAP